MPLNDATVAPQTPPFARVAASVLADSQLNATQRLVYCLLALHADKRTRATYVKNSTLATLLGRKVGAVTAARSKLADLGYVETTRRYAPGGRRLSDRITLLDQDLMRLPGSYGLAAAAVLRDRSLTPGARTLYAAATTLATREDRDIRWRTEVELAHMVGSGRRQSAGEWLGDLADRGFLELEHHPGTGSRIMLLDAHLLTSESSASIATRELDGPTVTSNRPAHEISPIVHDHSGAQEPVTGFLSPVTEPAREIGNKPARETTSNLARQVEGLEQTQESDPGTHKDVVAPVADATAGEKTEQLAQIMLHLGFAQQDVERLIDILRVRHQLRDPVAWILAALAAKGTTVNTLCRLGAASYQGCGWTCLAANFAAKGLLTWWDRWEVQEWDVWQDRHQARSFISSAGYDDEETHELLELLECHGVEWPGLYIEGWEQRGGHVDHLADRLGLAVG